MSIAASIKKDLRIMNQRNNAKKLMQTLKAFSNVTGTEVIRFRKGNGDSLQVLWEMAREKVGLTNEQFDSHPLVIVKKINESRCYFTETLPLYFNNIDRKQLVQAIQNAGLTIVNPDEGDNRAVMVKIGVSYSDVETTAEYKDYMNRVSTQYTASYA